MSTISRPAKEGGYLTYAAKRAAGFIRILSAEMDADIQAILSVVNGAIDATNITAGSITNALINATAAIAYSKLNLANSIVNGDIAPGAAIAGSKLAATSVALAQLAVGAAIADLQHTTDDTSVSMPNSPINTEAIVFEQTWTSRGGKVLVLGYAAGTVLTVGAGPFTGTLTTKLRQDGTPATVDGTVLRTASQQGTVTNTAPQPWTLALVASLTGLSAGTHRIKLTGATDTTNVAFRRTSAGLLIVEWA